MEVLRPWTVEGAWGTHSFDDVAAMLLRKYGNNNERDERRYVFQRRRRVPASLRLFVDSAELVSRETLQFNKPEQSITIDAELRAKGRALTVRSHFYVAKNQEWVSQVYIATGGNGFFADVLKGAVLANIRVERKAERKQLSATTAQRKDL